MFAARSSWHSYPYPLRGRKAEGQGTQTPEAADLSAFFLLFQSSVGVPTESVRNSERFFRNQPTVPNQPNTTNSTEPTGQNHTNHAAECLRPLHRGASSPRRSDRVRRNTYTAPRRTLSRSGFFFCTDKGPRKGSRRPRSRQKGELSRLCFTDLRARS